MNWPTIFGAILLAGAAIASAMSAREHRYSALICVAGLFGSWAIFVTSWQPWSVAQGLFALGIDAHSIDVWAACNCANGFLALYVARKSWWGSVLFGLLLNGCFADFLYWAKLLDWDIFKRTIDSIFLGEMTIFYILGGDHAIALFRDHVNRRRRGDPGHAAHQQAKVKSDA